MEKPSLEKPSLESQARPARDQDCSRSRRKSNDYYRPEVRLGWNGNKYGSCAGLASRSRFALAPADDAGPVIDRLPCIAYRFGKRFFFLVVEAPLALIVHLDQMGQCPPGAEKLAFGIVALDFGSQSLGHRLSVCTKGVNIKSKPPLHCQILNFT